MLRKTKKILKKFFGEILSCSKAVERPKVRKKAKNQKKPNILKTNEKNYIFDHILQKADKISEILKKNLSKSD